MLNVGEDWLEFKTKNRILVFTYPRIYIQIIVKEIFYSKKYLT